MKSYSVWIKQLGKWYRTDDSLNRLAAEVVRDYYKERGVNAEIREEKGQ